MGPWVEQALRDAACDERDERGLVPLATARRWIGRKRVFDRGREQVEGDRRFVEADRLWAALLSLEDAREFVKVASRLEWRHPQRGRDNAAPWERYGDAILPWLAATLGPEGRFPPNLWCAIPCLLRIGGPEAFALALRVRHPTLLGDWLERPPEGWPWLAERVAQGDEAALAAARAIGATDPSLVRERAPALADPLGLPPPDPRVTAALAEVAPIDLPLGRRVTMARVASAVREFDYPMWDNANYATGAMRVTGWASPVADALVFQSLVTGLGLGNVRREVHRLWALPGPTRVDETEILPESALFRWEGRELLCVATGVRRLPDRRYVAEAPRERVPVPFVGAEVPVRADTTGADPEAARLLAEVGPDLGLMVNLGQRHRDRVFLDPERLRAAAGLDPAAVPLFTFDAFALPLAGEPAAASPDLVAMVEALRTRRPIRRLPTGGDPLGGLIERLRVPGLRWGDPRFLPER